ncbi:MAG TPA: hemerythrin domain-containing protein [Candidatus Binatia bacterium]|jgi:hemerythrin superfamily protein|nr:hemerythrin domain-containing protein [Candidatus Binatia bacterium]
MKIADLAQRKAFDCPVAIGDCRRIRSRYGLSGTTARRSSMKATELLKKQHREVKTLFKQIEGTTAPAQRKKLMTTIIEKLKLHTSLEEDVYYPAVKEIETKKAHDMIMEAYEEHHVVDLVMAELPQVDPAADTFEAKMTVLKELIEHHVEEEEGEMFPMADKKLGEERSKELGAQMAAQADAGAPRRSGRAA